MLGCLDHTTKYDGYYFNDAAVELKYVQQYWITNGRPASIDLANVPWADGSLIDFTNVISLSNQVYHCRFASCRRGPPFGLMAVSDDGITLWINAKDGKVTVAPETNGVDR
jgi:hypothetical protein